MIFGAGDFTVNFGGFAMGGIGTATLAAIILYQALSIGRGKSVHPAEAGAAAE
ncbi:uracil-xanthine permease [Thalassospira profundimaris WP0211]|nr:uracil-xanthine permease [Thalassospira profundimaris WP0211]